jgi:hypothetical protein
MQEKALYNSADLQKVNETTRDNSEKAQKKAKKKLKVISGILIPFFILA